MINESGESHGSLCCLAGWMMLMMTFWSSWNMARPLLKKKKHHYYRPLLLAGKWWSLTSAFFVIWFFILSLLVNIKLMNAEYDWVDWWEEKEQQITHKCFEQNLYQLRVRIGIIDDTNTMLYWICPAVCKIKHSIQTFNLCTHIFFYLHHQF